MIKKLSVVIPAYNEAATIESMLNRVAQVQLINGIEKELIIVNDASTDKTEEVILAYQEKHPELNIQYEFHEKNGRTSVQYRLGTGKRVRGI